ncbi:carbohydrate kinase family protein [Natronoarchaeum rubrum]|uniref:carbohydrate kinase family protein n=1 Tax=Natronoarchaeum rubrum TaxID=755311 RepID=UPI002111733B|nr:carbohydrate kinase [Natronoarchaeum rubrum]
MSDRSILVVGETLVDFLPGERGGLDEVESFRRRAGGAPANVAARLAALGDEPLFWTRVGDDAFGDFLVETLVDNGVPTRFVERDPDAKTTLAFVAHDDEFDRSFSFYRDGTADTRLQPDTVPTSALTDLNWLYVGGVVLASEPSRTAVFDLLERAREDGCQIYFDPNYRPELFDEDGRSALAEAVEYADVVKATASELSVLGYEEDEPARLCEAVCADGPHTVFLTLGGDGAIGYSSASAPWGEALAEHGGFEIEVTDTTGAGDAFVSGSLAAMDRRASDPAEVLRVANAAAALSTTETGAMEGLPTWDELSEFVGQRE